MSKVSLSVLAVLLLLFVSACSDEAESDNDSGITDNETANDTEQHDDAVSDDAVTDEITDETVDNELNDDLSDEALAESDEVADETVDETVDETPDETADEVQPDDDAVSGPSEAALLCCQEIVKEWWRCEGSFVFEAVQGCVDCVNALNTCEEFNPLDESFACKDECGAVCPPLSLKGDGSGTDRRKIADEYCAFIMDPTCGFSADDFSSLGAIDGLDACYDL